jgi:Sperm-tail PG-rich repeat
MKESAPFWSIRGRNFYSHSESVPGPGAYSPTTSILLTSPNYRVGTSQRKSLGSKNLTPGPGAYSPKSGVNAPSWSLY